MSSWSTGQLSKIRVQERELISQIAMEVLKGTATGVRYTIDVSGGENNSGVSTWHHTIFKIDGMTVMFTSGAPAVIGEGDQLVVAGRLKGRLLKAEAYVNQTAGVKGDAGMWASFAGMVFCLLLGAIALGGGLLWPLIPWLPSLDQLGMALAITFGGIFCGMGLYCLYRWRRIRDAVKLVISG
jgi:hypothetical protein